MSLMSFTGKQRNLLAESPEHCRQLKLPHPILTNEDVCRLRAVKREDFKVATLPALFEADDPRPGHALRRALERLVEAGEKAIREGASLLIVSDRGVSASKAPIPSLLATAALHHGLLARRLRSEAGIVVESGEPREVMHFCLLCGYGANAINPYLAFEAVHRLREDGDLPQDSELDVLFDEYITAVKKGILKTMSKMGISTLRSYHSAQQFEAVGLAREVIDQYFRGTASRIGGVGLDTLAREALARHQAAFAPRLSGRWTSSTAASTTSVSTANGISGTPRPSAACNTPCSTTTRRPTTNTATPTTNRAASSVRSAACSSWSRVSRCRWRRSSR